MMTTTVKPVKNHAKICLIVSLAIMAAAVILTLCGRGINMGIDFEGGLSMQYDLKKPVQKADIESILKDMGVKSYTLAVQGDASDSINLRIKDVAEGESEKVESQFAEKLKTVYPESVRTGDVNYVGPVAGASLIRNAVISVLIAAALMLIYIAIRFDFYSGLAAVLGLVHDVLIMLSFMVILRDLLQMNSSFIAAMLTIVGYSINNTIIIFDRIRSNAKKYPQVPRAEVSGISIRESLGRTLCTTATTLFTIVALCIFGVASIREFALPIIIGILSGVYSANMINGFVWSFFEERRRARKAQGHKSR